MFAGEILPDLSAALLPTIEFAVGGGLGGGQSDGLTGAKP